MVPDRPAAPQHANRTPDKEPVPLADKEAPAQGDPGSPNSLAVGGDRGRKKAANAKFWGNVGDERKRGEGEGGGERDSVCGEFEFV